MLTDLESLVKQAATGDGRGGKRPGAGRPRKDVSKRVKKVEVTGVEIRSPEELLVDGPPPPLTIPPAEPESDHDHGALNFVVPQNPGELFAGAKARKEVALAAKAELDFRVKSGQYLPRDAVRSALATAFQSVAQTLRSIPDNLERKLGVSPELAEAVSLSIDEAMGDLAATLEAIHLENNDSSNKD